MTTATGVGVRAGQRAPFAAIFFCSLIRKVRPTHARKSSEPYHRAPMSGPIYNLLKEFAHDSFGTDLDQYMQQRRVRTKMKIGRAHV